MTSPAVEVRSFRVTIPAGTLQSAPLITHITIPPRVVSAVHWKVPPGPSGLMGWQLTMSGGVAVIPTGGGYIIADNSDVTWPLAGFPNSGAWEVTGYNTDIYPHSIYLDFLLDLVGAPGGVVSLLPSGSLSSPAGVTTAITTPGPLSVPLLSVPAITTPAALSVPVPVSVPQPVFVSTPPPITTPAGVVGLTVAVAVAQLQAGGWLLGNLYLEGIAGLREEQSVPIAQYLNDIVVGYTYHPTGQAGQYQANSVDLIVA